MMIMTKIKAISKITTIFMNISKVSEMLSDIEKVPKVV